jgi:hypothetical protein
MAFTAVGALVSGSAAVTAGTILAAVAEVGLALSVVGGITGNKTLSKIGGVMSLVGGVGGMLAGGLSSGGASAASGLADAGADAATSAAWSAGEGLGQDTLTNMGLDAAGGTGGGGIINTAQSAAPDLASSLSMNPTDAALQAGTKATPGQMAVGGESAATAAGSTVNDVAGAQMPVGVQSPAGAQGPKTPFDVGSNSLNAPQSSTSFFDKFSKFADGNKTLFNSGLQLVGGALKGANESAMFDKKVDLEQQRINQTKFGNTTSAFQPRKTGIIAGAQVQ